MHSRNGINAIGIRTIGPVDILVKSRADAIDSVVRMVAGPDRAIFGFANAHSVNLARDDARFARTLAAMSLFNDGIGVSIASRLLYGADFPGNLNGTDLTPAILAALPPGTRLFLLGSAPGIADRAGQILAARFGNIVIAGAAHGYFDPGHGAQIARQIASHHPDLVLVAMGQPRQEEWAVANRDVVGATMLCVGAFLDFTAGQVPRAPPLIRRARMEWAYRLAIEPRRLARRYLLGNVTFLWAVIRQRRAGSRA